MIFILRIFIEIGEFEFGFYDLLGDEGLRYKV